MKSLKSKILELDDKQLEEIKDFIFREIARRNMKLTTEAYFKATKEIWEEIGKYTQKCFDEAGFIINR